MPKTHRALQKENPNCRSHREVTLQCLDVEWMKAFGRCRAGLLQLCVLLVSAFQMSSETVGILIF